MPFLTTLVGKIMGGAVVVLLIAAGIFYWQWQSEQERHEDTKAELALANANLETLERDFAAREGASIERAQDTAETVELQNEMVEEIRKAPDSLPSDAAVRLGCLRLRAAGRDTSAIPACSRLDGGSEAGASG